MTNYIRMEEDGMMALELPSGCALPSTYQVKDREVSKKEVRSQDCGFALPSTYQVKDREVSKKEVRIQNSGCALPSTYQVKDREVSKTEVRRNSHLPSTYQVKDREVSKKEESRKNTGCALPSTYQVKDREVSKKEERRKNTHIPEKYFVDRRIASLVSIFRYPNFLKDSKSEKAYVPQAVSLGPYHSSRANLSGMKDHKMRARHRMMIRFNINHSNCPHDRELYNSAIGKISQDEEAVWNNYEDKFPDKSCDLVLDGCFLLEILRTLGGDELIWEGSNYYEPIFDQRKIEFTGFDILNDILMLENQIPLVVLRKLLELEFNSVDTADKFLFEVLVRTPGTKFYPFDYDMEQWSWPQPVEQVHHFLGLLYRLVVSPPSNDGDERAIQIDDNGKQRCIPNAVQLSNVGIKFQRWDGGIKKIYFDPRKATIYLPPINVTDHTEVLFRNLIALELCQASEHNYVTSYLSLMDNLIDTNEDVAVLTKSKIVINYLGSEAEVAELFNGLCKGVCLPPEDVFKELHNNVLNHYNNNFKVWIAQFIKDYVSSPWKFLAFLGAILALVLTLLQTIYSILAYYK